MVMALLWGWGSRFMLLPMDAWRVNQRVHATSFILKVVTEGHVSGLTRRGSWECDMWVPGKSLQQPAVEPLELTLARHCSQTSGLLRLKTPDIWEQCATGDVPTREA